VFAGFLLIAHFYVIIGQTGIYETYAESDTIGKTNLVHISKHRHRACRRRILWQIISGKPGFATDVSQTNGTAI